MTHYQIIKDEEKLREFINWLPELEKDETYYLCLFARSKYSDGIVHIKSDRTQMARFTCRKDKMFDRIWQLEVPIGAYKQRDTVIPQEALALYITPNPRSLTKAFGNTLVGLAESMRTGNTGDPHVLAMSEIHKARSRSVWVDFDVDEKDESKVKEVMMQIGDFINEDAVQYLKTRGGLHVLIDPSKVAHSYKSTWYQNISNLAAVDLTGDMMIPVPGCTQGNYIPHFIKPDHYANIPFKAFTVPHE